MKRFVTLLMGILLVGCGFSGCSHDIKPLPVPPAPPAPAPVVKEQVVVVHFKFASSKLSKADKLIINAAVVAKQPGTPMTIVGYTDSTGSKAYNKKLSERRAKAVSKYLRKLKVVSDWSGLGETNLLNPDKTKAEHQANRRATVGFTVIVK